jgi:DNA-binding MarR family transcriptional regulator
MASKGEIRFLYVDLGKSVTDIANSLGITTGSVYSHIKNLGGLDRLNQEKIDKSLSLENIRAREDQFLSALISNFDKYISENGGDLAPEKLEKFAKAYQSITSAKNHNPNRIRREANIEMLESLKNLAIQKESNSVLDFLSENAEVILNGI